jgi:hypothetical protein
MASSSRCDADRTAEPYHRHLILAGDEAPLLFFHGAVA